MFIILQIPLPLSTLLILFIDLVADAVAYVVDERIGSVGNPARPPDALLANPVGGVVARQIELVADLAAEAICYPGGPLRCHDRQKHLRKRHRGARLWRRGLLAVVLDPRQQIGAGGPIATAADG